MERIAWFIISVKQNCVPRFATYIVCSLLCAQKLRLEYTLHSARRLSIAKRKSTYHKSFCPSSYNLKCYLQKYLLFSSHLSPLFLAALSHGISFAPRRSLSHFLFVEFSRFGFPWSNVGVLPSWHFLFVCANFCLLVTVWNGFCQELRPNDKRKHIVNVPTVRRSADPSRIGLMLNYVYSTVSPSFPMINSKYVHHFRATL